MILDYYTLLLLRLAVCLSRHQLRDGRQHPPTIPIPANSSRQKQEVMVPKTDDLAEMREAIVEEIQSNYETNVANVSEKVYYSLASANAKSGKTSILYMYDDEDGVNFTYKAVSADPFLDEDFVFYAIDSPSQSMRNNQPLPGIQGMMVIDEENPAPRIFNF